MDFDCIVIGGGPGGYSAAVELAKSGKKIAVIEKENLGGVCTNIGCIPTKAYIEVAEHLDIEKKYSYSVGNEFDIKTKDIKKIISDRVSSVVKGISFLLKKNNITLITGTASFVDKNTIIVNGEKITAENIIIATGSLNAPFLDIDLNNQNIIDSTKALTTFDIPDSIIIIGGGAIGVEFAYIYNKLGTKVTLVEYFPNILPSMDPEASKTLERELKKEGIKLLTSSAVTKIDIETSNCSVNYNRKDKNETIEADKIFIATGRIPNSKELNLDILNLELDKKGFIITDERMKTSIDNIYAIGDIISNQPMLAHTAYNEAEVAVDSILNRPFKPLPKFVPFCVYTEPQIATFGLTEKNAEEKGIEFTKKQIFFRANGKAHAIGKVSGFIKILLDSNDLVIGASIVGHEASELIHQLIIMAELKIEFSKIKDITFAHPSLSELIKEIE